MLADAAGRALPAPPALFALLVDAKNDGLSLSISATGFNRRQPAVDLVSPHGDRGEAAALKMSCCGKKRETWRGESPMPPRAPSTPAGPVYFRYLGSTALTGSRTGNRPYLIGSGAPEPPLINLVP